MILSLCKEMRNKGLDFVVFTPFYDPQNTFKEFAKFKERIVSFLLLKKYKKSLKLYYFLCFPLFVILFLKELLKSILRGKKINLLVYSVTLAPHVIFSVVLSRILNLLGFRINILGRVDIYIKILHKKELDEVMKKYSAFFSNLSEAKPEVMRALLRRSSNPLMIFLGKTYRLLVRYFLTHIVYNNKETLYFLHPYIKARKYILLLPPVDTSEFKNFEFKKENLIITVGRIARERNILKVLEIAEELEKVLEETDSNYIIVGQIVDRDVYEMLKANLERYERISIDTDGSRKNILKYFERAKVIINYCYDSDRSIAIAEAITCNVIPVVFDSKLGEKKEGILYYEGIKEIPSKVFYAIRNYEDLLKKLSKYKNMRSSTYYLERILKFLES